MRKQAIAASVIVLASAVYASAANAVGSGPIPMPIANFTDMPSYHPKPVECLRWGRCVVKHARRWSCQIEQPQGSR
jgi:hypothetical protein